MLWGGGHISREGQVEGMLERFPTCRGWQSAWMTEAARSGNLALVRELQRFLRHAVFPEAALVALKAGYVDVADVLV